MKKYLEEGRYVPDETMISLIGREIDEAGDRSWLLDGESKFALATLTSARTQP